MIRRQVALEVARAVVRLTTSYAASGGFKQKPNGSSAAKSTPFKADLPRSVQDNASPAYGVSTEQTIAFQNREITKQILLLEGHLQQGCKIDGTACDCCEKHPINLEALAEETLGMTGDPVYDQLARWCRQNASKMTAEASASGSYDAEYPHLAVELRELRKQVMRG